MKISVVTVCLNAADTIEQTVRSVVNQTYSNMEYIIMDGGSVDGTLDIMKRYQTVPYMKLITGKDTGLYNAMNKSIEASDGDYIIFLNSGDVFLDEKVLENVVKAALDGGTQPKEDIFFGNVLRVYESGEKLERYPGRGVVFRLLMMGKMPCHQGIFTRKDVMKRYQFNEEYRICADFDFLLRCHKNHVAMRYVDVDVSRVDCAFGVSSQKSNLDKMRAEDDRSIRENYPVMYYLMYFPKKILRKTAVTQ